MLIITDLVSLQDVTHAKSKLYNIHINLLQTLIQKCGLDRAPLCGLDRAPLCGLDRAPLSELQ